LPQQIGETCIYGQNTKADGGGYGQNIGDDSSASQVPTLLANEMYNGKINFFPLPYS
jgi:hypothetical protein